MAKAQHRIEKNLTEQYPAIYRIAMALCGNVQDGKTIVDEMLQRGLRRTASRHRSPPARWFEHHTVLLTRRAPHHSENHASDPLIASSPQATPHYCAFIKAIRNLPQQKSEAFILYHGGQFDLRRLAVAMDCSTEATRNHLKSAENTLQNITGEAFDQLTGVMQAAFANLLPHQDIYLPSVKQFIRKKLRRRMFMHIIYALILLAACIYGILRFMPILDV